MTGGVTLPWRMQKLKVGAPSLSYDNINKALKCPKGKRWNYDALNKEWSMVDAEKPPTPSPPTVLASVVTDDKNGLGNTNNDGPAPCAFMAHRIETSDTFQGICLRYKITPLELRRANGGFTGDNLHLCPNPLKIPRPEPTATVVEGAQGLSQNELVGILLRRCSGMSRSEAKAYLMLSDWDLNEALTDAKEDGF